MANYLVSYDKTMEFKAKPMAALWAMDGFYPIKDMGQKRNSR
jgi:hypothetical protein